MRLATERTSNKAPSFGVFANTGVRSETRNTAGATCLSEQLASWSPLVCRVKRTLVWRKASYLLTWSCHLGTCPSRTRPHSSSRESLRNFTRSSTLRGHASQSGSSPAGLRVVATKTENDVKFEEQVAFVLFSQHRRRNVHINEDFLASSWLSFHILDRSTSSSSGSARTCCH